jgi:hypothetical protein
MRRRFVVLVAAASLLAISASACSGEDTASGNESAATTSEATPASQISWDTLSANDFDRGLFDESSATIDNEWLSWDVGDRFIWNGHTVEEGERIPRRIVFTVTDMTKKINGIDALVGWDRDFRDGKLLETELVFFAQDKGGNVWHLGQYVEMYDEEGVFDGGHAWMVGHVEGAKAGIHMRAEPKLGTRPTSMGFAPPPYFWHDVSKTDAVAKRTCGPSRCWKDIVVIDEYEPSKPGAHQLKYYAHGIGNVRVGWRGNDPDQEVLYLDKVVRLGPEAMAKSRDEVRAHEERANVLSTAPPAEALGG